MLHRVADWFEWFGIAAGDRGRAEALSRRTAARHDYCDLKDYYALSAALLHVKPRLLFEIGTYRGVTADFILELLPDCRVVSIAYVLPRLRFLQKDYNNAELSKEEVGSDVALERLARFDQLYGDSHRLRSARLVKEFGPFDMVLIDGDHSREGVRKDTRLARELIAENGAICWHDANPKEKFVDVRAFLEQELPEHALATADEYVGGIACWRREIEERLLSAAGQQNDCSSAGDGKMIEGKMIGSPA